MTPLNLFVARLNGTKGFTGGRLYCNAVFECFTLEDEVREVAGQPVEKWKIKDKTAIPRGKYRVILSFSPHFQKRLPELLNVPGFTDIRIHKGNTDVDTKGCLLVGDGEPENDFMGKSGQAFDRVFARISEAINTGEEVWITLE